MDRRVARTRKLISNAFLKLLKEKGFEKITIQDIADEADINRGTVYLHFEDKYHLMDYCIDSYVDEMLTQCSGSEEIKIKRDSLQMIFDYLRENKEIYKLLLENDKNGTFLKAGRSLLILAFGLTNSQEEIIGDSELIIHDIRMDKQQLYKLLSL